MISIEDQRALIEQPLNEIKGMIERNEISAEQALLLVRKQAGEFDKSNVNPDFKKFSTNSGLIYQNEKFTPTSYPLDKLLTYSFKKPSIQDVNTLFKLHQHLKGKPYESPEQLREVMKELVAGKRILEIGCGPGFNLQVLEQLGANVTGVEKRKELLKFPDLNVLVGDAQNLGELLGKEQFDLIYSRDLFSTAIMDENTSAAITEQTYNHTVTGGLGMHHLTYIKISEATFLLGTWIKTRGTKIDSNEIYDRFWNLSPAAREDALYTNRSTLHPQDLLRQGFHLDEYSIENNELNIVTRK